VILRLQPTDHRIAPSDLFKAAPVDIQRDGGECLLPGSLGLGPGGAVDLPADLGAVLAEDDGGGTLPALNRKGHHNRVATPRPAAKMGRLRLEIEGSLGDHFVPSH